MDRLKRNSLCSDGAYVLLGADKAIYIHIDHICHTVVSARVESREAGGGLGDGRWGQVGWFYFFCLHHMVYGILVP